MMDIRTQLEDHTTQLVLIGLGGLVIGGGLGYFLGAKSKPIHLAPVEGIKEDEPEDGSYIFGDEVFSIAIDEPLDYDYTEVEGVELPKDHPVLGTVYDNLIEKYATESDMGDEDDMEDDDPDEDVEDDQRKVVIDNVFASTGTGWDYDEELASRSSKAPYIIHQDEFMGDERGFDQLTFTYYGGDDILVDEQEIPVHKYVDVVGQLRFGHGSNDKNVVYSRNEELGFEYEILRTDDFYQIEVLGHSEEMAHEARKTPLSKFRED